MTFTADDVETTPVVIEIGGEMCLFQNPLEGGRLLDSHLHWAISPPPSLPPVYKVLGLIAGPPARPGLMSSSARRPLAQVDRIATLAEGSRAASS